MALLLLMLSAVQFNDKISGVALEVGDVQSDGALPSEFEACKLTGTEVAPQQLFGVGGVSSEASCSGGEAVFWLPPSLN